jgi:hypothetical protein
MITIRSEKERTMQAICQNPFCGAEITVLPGHRPRKYCNGRCKVAAFRARNVEAGRACLEAEQLAQHEREREALRRSYGDLLPETLDLLQQVSRQKRQLADQVGQAINAERKQATRAASVRTQRAFLMKLCWAEKR